MLLGAGFPDAFVSVFFIHKTPLAKNGKTMVFATLGHTLAFPQVSPQMRRLFGSCGYAPRQDVSTAQDMNTVAEEEDFEAWAGYRKAERPWESREGQGRGAHHKRH